MTFQSRSGFTLIEILVAVTILAFVAFGVVQAVRSTITTQEVIDYKSAQTQLSRAVLSVMERDFTLAFMVRPEDLLYAPTPKPKDDDPAAASWYPAERPVPVSYFQGTADQVLFSTRSHQRSAANAPENKEAFVTYQLIRGDLVRAETPFALHENHKADQKLFRTQVLLSHVSKLRFEFWDFSKDSWTESWDSEKSENKERLPGAIRVELEFDPKQELGDSVKLDSRAKEKILIQTSFSVLQATLRDSIAGTTGANPPVSSGTPNPNSPAVQ